MSRTFAFRATEYYLDLIDWDDPRDPIRRIIFPDPAELDDYGELDASNEAANTVVQGVQHKYRDTALVLITSTCAGLCRYCFRKRLFLESNDEVAADLGTAVAYISVHPEITDVLLTGGDALTLTTERLDQMLGALGTLPHVQVVRLGSKVPAFDPHRILDDPSLTSMLAGHAARGLAVHVMAHFDHPRELTSTACEAVRRLRQAGVQLVNQCPLVRGVNDDVDVLATLFQTTTRIGAPQYYLFQGRPVQGNRPYVVPITTGWRLFDAARRRCSGLSRRVRFCMSHASGKIEVLAIEPHRVIMRYHRARRERDESRLVVRGRDDRAAWLDELPELPAAGWN